MFQYFYHKRIRKAVSVFGSLFKDIYVVREASSGAVLNQVKVPLSYAPKRNFIDRIAQMNNTEDFERTVAIKLPRMSFEIVGIEYDITRQLPKTLRCNFPPTEGGVTSKTKLFTGTPYNIQFELNIYAKSQDDALQVVEQIVPYFKPQYTVAIKPIAELEGQVSEDTPITLQSVTFQDDYEGPLEQRRTIIYTLSFEMKINFYGPLLDTPIIRSVRGEILEQGSGLNDSDQLLETIITEPTPDGVSPDSDFGFNDTIYQALDSVP